ncbi:UDP-glucuronosyltransferase 2C1-like [Branchiostoma lanceolatum]|uniref:UDP-glucuronosyltransferase 2C1-like n=1 Tax=Branchiostoma lanceolatum TaxID=7740 RepID=UPI0034570088
MTYLQRVQNVGFYGLVSTFRSWIYGYVYDDLIRKHLSERETFESLASRTDLWLYQSDTVLGFPRPSMPNMVPVGGLTVRAGAPLSKDMEDFMQSSGDDGVIVVSFGSMVQKMSTERKEMFAAVFAQLRQKVVWRDVGEKPTGLGNNTKLMSWLPQNHLLAHPKTRAFVSHAGLNGVYEALYHGVPMVCLPLFSDHPGSAARVQARGLGVKLDFGTVTSDELYQAVLDVLTNNSYRETAARLSRLYRDQPQTAMERAVWWIEHVIKHGGLPHLRARAVDLPFYQYYLLDVAACLLAVCSAVLGTVWCSCSLVCRKICCKAGGKLKSQ